MAKKDKKYGEKRESRKEEKQNRKAQKKAGRKEKYAQLSLAEKIGRFAMKICLFILPLMLLVTVIAGVLAYYQMIDVPGVSAIMDHFSIHYHSADVEKDIPETDTEGFTYYESSEENLVKDDETGVMFVNNELLVTLVSEEYKSELEEYVSTIGGNIAGELPEAAEYQILLPATYSYAQLQEIIEDMKTFEWFSYASPNCAMQLDPSYVPNDKNWKYKWENVADGTNWGMEAIDAPGAWEYREQLRTVNIGVFDIMFDTNHEDLNFAEDPYKNAEALEKVESGDLEWSNHGTHVAGTIAATFNNKKGIAGVIPKVNLYGASVRGIQIEEYCTAQAFNTAFYYLIVKKGCSAVNLSLGMDALVFGASRHEKADTEILGCLREEVEEYLKKLIDKNYSFVICAASGNMNESGGGYRFFRRDDDDTSQMETYYSYNEYLEYLNGTDTSKENIFARYKDRREEIESRLDSGNVDVKYDLFGGITDPKVRNRIIMVGAAKNLGTHTEGGFLGIIGKKKVHNGYAVAAFSQCGEGVDVIAPGVDIYSTVKNGYDKDSGTSMAAPHVTGVAGLIFAANSNMKADAVRKIVRESATGSYGGEGYGLVNARLAVEAAQRYNPENSDTKQTNIPAEAGTFNGHRYYVYNRDNITTWEEAKQYCESKGGYLATITSQEENAYVYSYLRDNFDYESAYFGFTDEEEDGNWEWENNEEVSYTNWHPGEPNGQDENEKHAMYYYKYLDGSWNDGNFEDDAWNGDGSFICEWGDYQERMDSPDEERQKMTSGERNIVLVLDASGSMSGDPMMQTRKAAKNFASTILKEDASIGVVAYSENAEKISDFSSDETHLTHTVEDIGSDGGTNMEAGLAEAKAMLDNSNAKKKIIVLMSDGEPNEGKQGEELINYAEQIKNDGILVYTLGFFESMEGSKSAAQYLMEKIASDGCHYEVANADDLVFFFGDVADQINGQKYIYIRIACPVEVSVTYKGESLNSAEEDQTVRTDFGTLTFEDNEDSSYEQENDRIKVLRLKEGADYDVQIVGTDRGKMNYTIGFMDENGDYSDFRYFDDIRVTQRTVIDTVATVSKESILKIDEDGDGKYEKKLRAKENGYGEEVKRSIWVYIAAGAGVVVSVAFCIVIVLDQRKHEKRRGKIPLK